MDVTEESLEKGRGVRRAMSGDASARTAVTEGAFNLVPELEEWLLGYVWGEIWSRPALDLKTRSALTLALQAVVGAEAPMRAHLVSALRLGWSTEEIAEVFVQQLPYVGAPKALAALRTARDVFVERGVA